MSETDLPDPSNCDHEYSDPRPPFLECCRCKKWLSPKPSLMHLIPDHWFRHSVYQLSSTVRELVSDMRTGADVINGDFPPTINTRHIQICGSCGHWLSAVRGSYFYRLNDGDFTDSSFADDLRESLCPKCGVPISRWSTLVTPLTDARRLTPVDIREYLVMRESRAFWTARDVARTPGGGYIDKTRQRMGSVISPILPEDQTLVPRCPACARPQQDCRAEFDFHHWDYDNHIGCKLCRWCHKHIHRDMRARDQAELTDDWRRDAERRLLKRCQRNGLEFSGLEDFQRRFGMTRSAIESV